MYVNAARVGLEPEDAVAWATGEMKKIYAG